MSCKFEFVDIDSKIKIENGLNYILKAIKSLETSCVYLQFFRENMYITEVTELENAYSKFTLVMENFIRTLEENLREFYDTGKKLEAVNIVDKDNCKEVSLDEAITYSKDFKFDLPPYTED